MLFARQLIKWVTLNENKGTSYFPEPGAFTFKTSQYFFFSVVSNVTSLDCFSSQFFSLSVESVVRQISRASPLHLLN